ncbi:hypothetical protein FA13DRAFT_1800658 [Coprinellus micaceus]|uniref:F-box domain-containing protein n=1 Tax=Coprinellus micaceus TaxID=71717 RepID=A0A4Y7SG20_COPMI|nr:hypothetical protein FA13DRAFT_1800658 [Coprinellus micaceus]
MLLSLPPELVELIVDHVARSSNSRSSLESLSRVSKFWTHPCQQRLWAEATIFTSHGSADDARTQLLSGRIRSQPHIGSYIRSLQYWAYSPVRGSKEQHKALELLAGALRCITNLVDFTLGYGGQQRRSDVSLAFDGCPASWRKAVAGLVTAPSLRHLTLQRISQIPYELVERALGNLASLTLLKCRFTGRRQGRQENAFIRGFKKYFTALGSITCDGHSYRSLQEHLDPLSEVQSCGPERSVKLLELRIEIPVGDGYVTRNLTELDKLPAGFVQHSATDCLPLDALLLQVGSSVHTSLTSLTITAHNGSSLTPTVDPLLELCSEKVLRKFTSLQTLNLTLHFDSFVESTSNSPLEQCFQSPLCQGA